MNLGENIKADETGCITGCETGRVIAKFSHVSEGESFVEMVNFSCKIGVVELLAKLCEGINTDNLSIRSDDYVLYVSMAQAKLEQEGWSEVNGKWVKD